MYRKTCQLNFNDGNQTRKDCLLVTAHLLASELTGRADGELMERRKSRRRARNSGIDSVSIPRAADAKSTLMIPQLQACCCCCCCDDEEAVRTALQEEEVYASCHRVRHQQRHRSTSRSPAQFIVMNEKLPRGTASHPSRDRSATQCHQ